MGTADGALRSDFRSASIRERAADLLLIAVLALSIWDGQRIWGTEISRTRELFVIYCLLAITLLGRPWRVLPRSVFVPGAVLLGLAVAGLLTWARQLDWELGVNFWSEIVTLGACLLFGLAYGAARWPAWRLIIIGAGVAVSLLQLVSLLLGVTTRGFSPGAPGFYAARPIAAQIALLILAGYVLLLLDTRIDERVRLPLACLLGVSVVLAQHRSVWVALVVVLVLTSLMTVRGSLTAKSGVPVAVTGACFLAALVLPLAGVQLLPGGESSGAESSSGLPDVARSSDTLQWRWDMWTSRLQAPRSVIQWMIGGSAGQTPAFGPGSTVMNPGNSAHSMFIDVQVMLGFAGLAMVLWLFYLAVLRLARLTELGVFMWGAMAYGFFYIWPSWVWIVLGAAAALSVPAAVVTSEAGQGTHPIPQGDATSGVKQGESGARSPTHADSVDVCE